MVWSLLSPQYVQNVTLLRGGMQVHSWRDLTGMWEYAMVLWLCPALTQSQKFAVAASVIEKLDGPHFGNMIYSLFLHSDLVHPQGTLRLAGKGVFSPEK